MRESARAGGADRAQSDAMLLLKAIAEATEGTDNPVVLDELTTMPVSAIRAQMAFRYLKTKGLIEANFGIFYAARLSSSGHEALAASFSQEPAPKLSIWNLKEVARKVGSRSKKA